MVDDVALCKNYIACDAETQSEIVVPVLENGEVFAVLDIDSEHKAWFSEVDKQYLEKIAQYVVQ